MEVGAAGVDDMAARFGVSRMTIHRDLDELESDGLLRKVRGGASVQSNSRFESDFQYRRRLAAEEKAALAREAAAKVEPGHAIILDDGSTVHAMVPHLVDKRPLTVITTNVAVAEALMAAAGITLIVPGGQYSRRFHGYFGLLAEQTLEVLRADLAFISTSSVSGTKAFHQDQEVVKTKRAIIAAADRRFLLIDHTKFDRTALNVLTDLTDFEAVITGREPSAAARAALERARVRLEIAGSADA